MHAHSRILAMKGCVSRALRGEISSTGESLAHLVILSGNNAPAHYCTLMSHREKRIPLGLNFLARAGSLTYTRSWRSWTASSLNPVVSIGGISLEKSVRHSKRDDKSRVSPGMSKNYKRFDWSGNSGNSISSNFGPLITPNWRDITEPLLLRVSNVTRPLALWMFSSGISLAEAMSN